MQPIGTKYNVHQWVWYTDGSGRAKKSQVLRISIVHYEDGVIKIKYCLRLAKFQKEYEWFDEDKITNLG